MLTLIDYGVGNINAFLNIYKQLNIPVKVAQTASEVKAASKIILPGVGHFDYAMERFASSGMKEVVNEFVLEKEVPVIGICVGMQMMATTSEEGKTEGLGWINAKVKRFDDAQRSAKAPLPHMGWNDVYPKTESTIFTGLADSKFYFLHSYYFQCNDEGNVLAYADYGIEFACAVNHKNVYGVQFHPEKSHRFGITLLKNFAELC